MSQDNISFSGRLWIKLVLVMACLPLVGSLIDFNNTVQAGFGRTNNISLLWCFFFFAIFAVNLKHLRETRDRIFLIAGLSLALTVFLRTLAHPETDVYGVIGTLIVLFSTIAGFAAYAMARQGVSVHKTLVQAGFIVALFIPLAPIMVAMTPDAYDPYYLKVYGYSNVRVLGYFSGIASVVFVLMMPLMVKRALESDLHWRRAMLIWMPYLTGAMVSWSILFWSGSRAGMVAATAAILMTWILVEWPGLKAIFLSLSSIGLGALLSLRYYEPDGEFGLLERIHKTTSGLSSGNMTQVTSNRTDLWSWAMERIMDAPLNGHGLYAMSHMRTEQFNFFHTHNVILEYALGMGIPFAAVLGLVIFTLFIKAGLAARRSADPYAVACFGIVALIAGFAQFTAALFFPFTLMMFLMGLAGLVGLGKGRLSAAPGPVGPSVDVGK